MDKPSAVETVAERDLAELLPLLRAYCDFYSTSPSDQELLETARALIADPGGAGVQFIARDSEGNPIGFATLTWSYDTTVAGRIAVMNDLFVAPSARGSSLAERLIEACSQRAREGAARALRWQTAPGNKRAQSLYDRVASPPNTWLEYWIDL